MNPIREFISNAKRSGAPATTAIVAGIAICFLASFFNVGQQVFSALAFSASGALAQPWTFLSYPLAYPATNLIGALFLCLWIWGIGGSVERTLRTQRYVSFWIIMTLLGSVFVFAGSKIMAIEGFLFGAAIPTAATTVVWGVRNPNVEVRLMFVLPITGRWLAWLSAALVFFGTQPQLAPFAALPLLFAYLFAADKLSFLPFSSGRLTKAEAKRESRRVFEVIDNAIDRQKSRAEREKLRRLFENSGIKDEEEA